MYDDDEPLNNGHLGTSHFVTFIEGLSSLYRLQNVVYNEQTSNMTFIEDILLSVQFLPYIGEKIHTHGKTCL